MKRFCLAITTTLLALTIASPASAQYIWLDKNNVKVYSDKPPPVDVPNSRVLKGPKGFKAQNIEAKQDSTNGTEADKPASAAASASKPPMTTAEKNADFKKRQQEQAEKEKKGEAEEKNRQAKAENCERARQYQRSIQSGQRITRTNEKGAREHMSDEERNNEARKVEDTLKDCN